MISNKQQIHISKFLSLVLRHKPEKIGLNLDKNGWVDIDELLEKVNKFGIRLDRVTLNHIVATNSKKRFAIDETTHKIRASQGHSFEVDLGYSNQKPPEILYHGTGEKSVQSILDKGLEKGNRQHIHLSTDIETAIKVGQRHGEPKVFEVLGGNMFKDGYQFYISDNGVWLTDHVPPKYLRQILY